MIVEIDNTHVLLEEIGKEQGSTHFSFYNKELDLTIIISLPFGEADEYYLMSHYGNVDSKGAYCEVLTRPYLVKAIQSFALSKGIYLPWALASWQALRDIESLTTRELAELYLYGVPAYQDLTIDDALDFDEPSLRAFYDYLTMEFAKEVEHD